MAVHIGEFEVVPSDPPEATGDGGRPAAERPSEIASGAVADEIDRRLARRAVRKARLEAC
jgi:hypothetical protein